MCAQARPSTCFLCRDLRWRDTSAQAARATWRACSVASQPPSLHLVEAWSLHTCFTLRNLETLPGPRDFCPPGTTALEHPLGPTKTLRAPPPTHDEDGHEAGQRGVPVPAARGCRLAHQHAVEDEVSEAQLHTPCVGKTESIIPGAGALRGLDGVASPPARSLGLWGKDWLPRKTVASWKRGNTGVGRPEIWAVKSWHV